MANPNFPNNPGYNLYVGARYVPLFASPIEWDESKTYEPLTIVSYQGNSYTSKTFVPANTPITNTTYWALTGNYNAQVEQYRQEVSDLSNRVNNYWKSVEDFGAVADGSTDNYEAFNQFFEYISNNNIEGYIPAGEYFISNWVGLTTVNKGISFHGDGIDKTIILGNNNDCLYFKGLNLVKITDLTVNCQTPTPSTMGNNVGLNIQSCNNVYVERVKAVNCNNYGMWSIGGSNNISITNSHFNNCIAEHCFSGIQVQGASYSSIENCYTNDIEYTGVAFKVPSTQCFACNILSVNNRHAGFDVGSSYPGVKMTDSMFTNIVTQNCTNGVAISSMERCIINGLYVTMSEDSGIGIDITNSKNNVVKNAYIKNLNGGYAIQCRNTRSQDCANNYIELVNAEYKAGSMLVHLGTSGEYTAKDNIILIPSYAANTANIIAMPDNLNYIGIYGGNTSVLGNTRLQPTGNNLNINNTAIKYIGIYNASAYTINNISGGYYGRVIYLIDCNPSNSTQLTSGGNIRVTDPITLSNVKATALIYCEDNVWIPLN